MTPHPRHAAVLGALLLLTPLSQAFSAGTSPATAPPNVAPSPAPAGGTQIQGIATSMLVNGDFETSSFNPNSCLFNLPNATLNAFIPGITAYGPADEIDSQKSPTNCLFGGPPESGQTKLCLHRQSAQFGNIGDEFSFQLSSGVVSGSTYTITFYAWSVVSGDPDVGTIDIGLSSVATAFGTPVWTTGQPNTDSWTFMSTSFVAPVSASYLTVRVTPGLQAWIHVDNFALEPGGATAVTARTWGTLKVLYRD